MSDHTTRQTPQENPYGYCHCGCGQKTKIASKTSKHHGWTKGEPKRFINGHNARKELSSGPKLCACGCGETVKTKAGNFKRGHTRRLKVGRPIADRFWEKVARADPDECWSWTGSKTPSGYGTMVVGSKKDKTKHAEPAHRLSYELHYGPIPPGLEICHRCDNPICVNPYHLFAGTRQDNVQDMVDKKRQTLGIKNARSKITDDIVRQIRALANTGEMHKTIAAHFGLSRAAVSLIVERKRWLHVE